MTKMMKRFALVLCLVALCVGMMSVAVLAAYDPVTAEIPVQITLSGTLPETPDTFQVEMTAADPTFPMPEGAVDGVYVMDLVGQSSGALKITYDKLGVYTYTVKQLPVANDDCYQDNPEVYEVSVFVTNNADYTAFDLVVAVHCNGSEEKVSDLIFANRYANPAYAQIVATKTMDKKAPKDGAFTFELVDAEGNVVQTVANDAEGNIIFEPIYCYEIGSTTYTLREVAGTNKKIIYDKTEYTVVVDVTKDDNGDYVATVTYLKGEDAVDAAAFANKTKPVVPQTGDAAYPLLWGGIMAAALLAIVVVLVSMKKKKA